MKRIILALALLAFPAVASAQQPCANGICPLVRSTVADVRQTAANVFHGAGALVAPQPQFQVNPAMAVPQSMPMAERRHPVREWWHNRHRLFGGCR